VHGKHSIFIENNFHLGLISSKKFYIERECRRNKFKTGNQSGSKTIDLIYNKLFEVVNHYQMRSVPSELFIRSITFLHSPSLLHLHYHSQSQSQGEGGCGCECGYLQDEAEGAAILKVKMRARGGCRGEG
jgi:hypothetical protein